MKHAIHLIFLHLTLLALPALASEPLVLGILENPQCQEGAPRVVRPLFGRHGTEWVALNSKKSASRFKLKKMSWTAAFDGKNLGNITSADPNKDISPDWTYPRDYFQQLDSGQALPTIKNNAKAFAGWCEAPEYLPIVVVSAPNFQDPQEWKPAASSRITKQQLLHAFRKAIKNAPMCQVSENEEGQKPYKYTAADIKIVKVYKNAQGAQLVSMTLQKPYTQCGSELGWPDNPVWFFVDNAVHYIGDNFTLIDSGDYDKDGKSEVMFWYSGYNEDGYVLFYDNFNKKVDFLWSYH